MEFSSQTRWYCVRFSGEVVVIFRLPMRTKYLLPLLKAFAKMGDPLIEEWEPGKFSPEPK